MWVLLAEILGGGLMLGTVVMVMEDDCALHHHLLLRNFMVHGVVHRQPVLFASAAKDPRAFLWMLPAPVAQSRTADSVDEKGLRIAWQYKKYFGEGQASESLI